MSRRRRIDYGKWPLHVIGRGVAGDSLFPDADSWALFWNEFGAQATEFGVSIGHVCLMRTHYHLLVRGNPEALANTLHRTHSKLAWLRNRDDQRRGAVFGRRYRVIPVDTAKHLLAVARYIPLNPVKSNVVRDPSDWRWSTHRFLAGRETPPAWFDVRTALRMVAFFNSRSYERWVLSDTPLAIPPMTEQELIDHRICSLAEWGMPIAEIADVLHLSARTVQRRIARSALRSTPD